MIAALKKYISKPVFASKIKETSAVEAYDIWADDYDEQPGNLMLDLDNVVFNELVQGVQVSGKQIADIGCGTGRHWGGIIQKHPHVLTGFDVSPGMIKRLNRKFPTIDARVITDNHFSDVASGTFDIIMSTLTMAHIENLDEAMAAWCRILKANGDIIITDFHPDALATGGQRTFRSGDKLIAVRNFVHPTVVIKLFLLKAGFKLINEREIKVDENLKHYYSAQNALHVYEKFKGSSMIYGLHFRRGA